MAFGVTCPACGKAFSITDEIYQRKVSGRVVTIKCKQCQSGIRVDASKPGVTKISAAAKEAEADKAIETKSVGPLPPQALAPAVAPAPRVRQATLIGGVANQMGKQAQAAAAAMAQPSAPPPPAPPPPPAAAAPAPAPAPARAPAPAPAAPPDTLWAVEVGDGQDREMPFNELRRELERGTIPATALAWRDGMAEWLEIRQVPELAPFLKKPAQPKPSALAAGLKPAIKASAPRIAEPPAPVAPPPVSEDVPTQPKGPTGPALPPPRAPMASAPKLPPPPPRASVPDPFAPPPFAAPPAPSPPAPPVMAPSPPAPAVQQPPPEPMFPAALSAEPAAAPRDPFRLAPSAIGASPAPPAFAPPAPAPAPAPVARPAPQTFATPGPVAASTDFEMPKVRSKAPLVIGAVAVVGAVIAAFVLIQGAEKQPVPLSPAAESPPVATATSPSTGTTSTPTSTSTPTAAADQADPAAGAQTTPGSGFAELFASGAREKEGDAVAPRFDPAEAKKAVAKTLTGVGKCKEPGGPRGNVSAAVTFDSSGRVSTVTIADAPFAGTSTASCLASVLKQATMPPFKGLPGTHTQTISVR